MTTLYVLCLDPCLDRMIATANAVIPPEVVLDAAFHDNHERTWMAAFLLMDGRCECHTIQLMSLGDERVFCLECDHQTSDREVQMALRLAITRLAQQDNPPSHAILVTHAPHPGLQTIEGGLAHSVRPGDAVTHYVCVVDGTLKHALHYTPCPVPMPG